MRRLNPFARGASALLVLTAAAMPAAGQSVESFYAGKTITLTIGFGPGGTYDYYARLVARHLGKHIPGKPSIVAQNMPGAGSLTASNYLFSVAAKDGTALGVVTQTIAIEEAVGNPGAKFKVAAFNWIGRASDVTQVQLTMATSKVKTIEDAKRFDAPAASTGAGSPTEGYPKILNGVLGTKFRPVGPYKGSMDGLLAMERGEVETASTSYTTVKQRRPDWISEKKANFLVQYARKRIPEMPDVPAFVELGKTPEDKQLLGLYVSGEEVGRSVLAPPGVPAERVAALRKAFMATMKDPDVLAEAAKAKAELAPMSGEELQSFITSVVQVPPSVVARMKAMLK